MNFISSQDYVFKSFSFYGNLGNLWIWKHNSGSGGNMSCLNDWGKWVTPGKERISQLWKKVQEDIYPYFSSTGTSFSREKSGSTEVVKEWLQGFLALKTPPALQKQNPH